MGGLLFDGWSGPLHTAIVGMLAYVLLILLLRVSGKRTLSKMNAFDFIVTVSLGSTLASVMLTKGTALAQGFTAFVVLIGLQCIVTWLSVRHPRVRSVVTGEPTLLALQGTPLPDAMRRARVTQGELDAAVRSAVVAAVPLTEAVVLETDGTFSVIAATRDSSGPG
jgi:uncharacterized membrane protein YcaP (DUF421 family)